MEGSKVKKSYKSVNMRIIERPEMFCARANFPRSWMLTSKRTVEEGEDHNKKKFETFSAGREEMVIVLQHDVYVTRKKADGCYSRKDSVQERKQFRLKNNLLDMCLQWLRGLCGISPSTASA